jgi:hypothetical protein
MGLTAQCSGPAKSGRRLIENVKRLNDDSLGGLGGSYFILNFFAPWRLGG